MPVDVILQIPTLKPTAIATIGGLALAILMAAVVSIVIKRRESARPAVQSQPAAVQTRRTQRTANVEAPRDVQQRLRLLTSDLQKPLADAAPPPVQVAGARPVRTGATGSLRVDPSAVQAQLFGGADGQAVTARPDDSTARFFGLEDADAPGAATRFFGADDAVGTDDATVFFGEEDAAPAGTARAEQDDVTRFFGSEDDEAPAPTQFFTVDELDVADGPDPRMSDKQTAMLHALPPARSPMGAPEAAPRQDEPAYDVELVPEPFAVTGALQALPQGQARLGTGALDQVRAHLAAVTTPQIVALSVLDGSGRVLAGENDDDLTGELRSLMAEAGVGTAADVDQPVRLGDDAHGAILLLPTGANALLGALMLESDESEATRADLRRLAHEIGDAMRRAS